MSGPWFLITLLYIPVVSFDLNKIMGGSRSTQTLGLRTPCEQAHTVEHGLRHEIPSSLITFASGAYVIQQSSPVAWRSSGIAWPNYLCYLWCHLAFVGVCCKQRGPPWQRIFLQIQEGPRASRAEPRRRFLRQLGLQPGCEIDLLLFKDPVGGGRLQSTAFKLKISLIPRNQRTLSIKQGNTFEESLQWRMH